MLYEQSTTTVLIRGACNAIFTYLFQKTHEQSALMVLTGSA